MTDFANFARYSQQPKSPFAPDYVGAWPVKPEGVPAPAADVSPALQLMFDREQMARDRALITQLQQMPVEDLDQMAEAEGLSIELGLDAETVKANIKQARHLMSVRQVEDAKMADNYPILWRQMQDPDFAALALDDFDKLSALEKMSAGWESANVMEELAQAAVKLRAQGGLFRTEGEKEHYQSIVKRMDALGHVDGFFGLTAQTMSQMAIWETGVAIGASALAAFIPPAAPMLLPLAIGLAGTVPAAIHTYELEGGLAYHQYKQAGIAEDVARRNSHTVGWVNSAIEMGTLAFFAKPFGMAGRNLANRSGLTRRLLGSALDTPTATRAWRKTIGRSIASLTSEVGQEVAQENVTALGEYFGKKVTEARDRMNEVLSSAEINMPGGGRVVKDGDKVRVTPDVFRRVTGRPVEFLDPDGMVTLDGDVGKRFLEDIREIAPIEAALRDETLLSDMWQVSVDTAGQAFIGVGLISQMGPALRHLSERKKIRAAAAQGTVYKEVQEGVKGSTYQQRAPSKMVMLMRKMWRGTKLQEVHIPREEFTKALDDTGVTVEELEEVFPGLAEQLAQPAEKQPTIVLDGAVFFSSEIAETEFQDRLVNHVKPSADSYTLTEMEAAEAKLTEEQKRLKKGLKKAGDLRDQVDKDTAGLIDNITANTIKAGVRDARAARDAATVLVQGLRARAEQASVVKGTLILPSQLAKLTGFDPDTFVTAMPEDFDRTKVFNQFAGTGATTADMPAFQRAKAMDAAGATAEEIRQATGWHVGPDGKARWELSDHNARMRSVPYLPRYPKAKQEREDEAVKRSVDVEVRRRAVVRLLDQVFQANEKSRKDGMDRTKLLAKLQMDLRTAKAGLKNAEGMVAEATTSQPSKLERVLGHPELYAAYPELADIEVVVEDMAPGSRGYYRRPSGGRPARIGISSDLVTEAEQRDVLLHEIQHIIQHREGFAAGGNPDMFAYDVITQLQIARTTAHNKLDEMAADPNNDADVVKLRELVDLALDAMVLRRELEPYTDPNTGLSLKSVKSQSTKEKLLRADSREAHSKLGKLRSELQDLSKTTLSTAIWPQTTLKDIMGRVDLQGKTTKQQQVLLHELYERLAGEAEARMTQSRQSMTPEERLAKAPDDTLNEDQLTRGDLIFRMEDSTGGLQLLTRAKPSPASSTNFKQGGKKTGNLTPSIPTAANVDVDVTEMRMSTMANAMLPENEETTRKNLALLDGEGYESITVTGDTLEERAESVIGQIVRNLRTIFNAVPKHIRRRSKLWYVGANRIARAYADRFGISIEQAAGALAAMSPQADWRMNVSYVERVLDTLADHQDHQVDAKMNAWSVAWLSSTGKGSQTAARASEKNRQVKSLASAKLELKNAKTPGQINKWTDLVAQRERNLKAANVNVASYAALTGQTPAQVMAQLDAIIKEKGKRGRLLASAKKKLAEARTEKDKAKINKWKAAVEERKAALSAPIEAAAKLPKKRLTLAQAQALGNPIATAFFIRAFDESHNGKGFREISPEGHTLGWVLTQSGAKDSLGWKSMNAIANAVSIIQDGSEGNISARLGAGHKVRNFYNNILTPNSAIPFVTSDTHQVAANFMLPLASSHLEVGHNFGTGKGSSSNSVTGLSGLYWIHHEAVIRAAKAEGVRPREMQSISWEAVRGLFTDKWKTDENVARARSIWAEHKAGKITYAQAIKQLVAIAGGWGEPFWVGHKPSSARAFGDGATSYEGDLRPGGVGDGPGESGAGGQSRSSAPVQGGDRRGTAGTGKTAGQVGGEKAALFDPKMRRRAQDRQQASTVFFQQGATFDESTYRPEVVAWAKEQFADLVAPNGRPMYQNFVEWFGDSKVVDAEGKPLVVYHTGSFRRATDVPQEGMHFGTQAAAEQRQRDKELTWQNIQIIQVPVTKEERDAGVGIWTYRVTDEIGMPRLHPETYATEEDAKIAAQSELDELNELEVQSEDDGVLMTEAYLSMSNPKRVADVGVRDEWDAVSAQAKAEGHDGLIYVNEYEDKGSLSWVVFEPARVKSAEYLDNDGNFSADEDGLLHQQNSEEGPRGSFDPATLRVILYKKHDPTTLVHEFAHLLFEIDSRMALQGLASPQQLRDMQILLDQFGKGRFASLQDYLTAPAEMREEMHEGVAYSFEDYMGKGVAPSKELANVFERLAKWMVKMYRNVRDTVAVNYHDATGKTLPALSDDVRFVFDRWLAADEEIELRLREEAVGRLLRATVADGESLDELDRLLLQELVFDHEREAKSKLRDVFMTELRKLRTLRGRAARKLQRSSRAERKKREAEERDRIARTDRIGRILNFLSSGDLLNDDGSVSQSSLQMRLDGALERLRIALDEREELTKELSERQPELEATIENATAVITAKRVDIAAEKRMLATLRKSAAPNQELIDQTIEFLAYTEAQVQGLDSARTAAKEELKALRSEIKRSGAAIEKEEKRVAVAKKGAAGVEGKRLRAFLTTDERVPERYRTDNVEQAEITDVEQFAQDLGYGSADSMFDELRRALIGEERQQREIQSGGVKYTLPGDSAGAALTDMVNDATDERMLSEVPHLADPAQMQYEIDAALSNEAIVKLRAAEIKLMEKLPPSYREMVRVAKEIARRDVAKLTTGDLFGRKNLVRSFTEQARRAERQAAMHRGDPSKVGQHQRTALYFRAMANEAVRTRAAIEKHSDKLKSRLKFRPGNGKREDTLARNYGGATIETARLMLDLLGVEVGSGLRDQGPPWTGLSEADPERQMLEHALGDVESVISTDGTLMQQTIEQAMESLEYVEGVLVQGKWARMFELEGRTAQLDEIIRRLREQVEAEGTPEKSRKTTAREDIKGKIRRWNYTTQRVEALLFAMDGDDQGLLSQLIFVPLRNAEDQVEINLAAVIEKLEPLLRMVRDEVGASAELSRPITTGTDATGAPLLPDRSRKTQDPDVLDNGKMDILGMLLHCGNLSNLRRLLLGFGWATERADGSIDATRWWEQVRQWEEAGIVTKADWEFCQGVWDIYEEELLPMTQEAHYGMLGRRMELVDKGLSVLGQRVMADGTVVKVQGGYVPAGRDPKLRSPKGERNAQDTLLGFQRSIATINKGHTKNRVDEPDPDPLDINPINQIMHFRQAIIFAQMGPAHKKVATLLRQRDVESLLERLSPGIYKNILDPLMETAATLSSTLVSARGADMLDGIDFVDKLRSNYGTAAMFANVVNSLQGVTGVLLAQMSGQVKTRFLMEGISGGHTKAEIYELSPFMATRHKLGVSAFEMQNRVLNLVESGKFQSVKEAHRWLSKNTYWMQEIIQHPVDLIVWRGAYAQAIDEGKGNRQAINAADGAVRRTQADTAVTAMAKIEKGGRFAKMWTQFLSWFLSLGSMRASAMRRATLARRQDDGTRAMWVVRVVMSKEAMAGFFTLFIGELIATAFRAEDDEEKDALDTWLIDPLLMTALAIPRSLGPVGAFAGTIGARAVPLVVPSLSRDLAFQQRMPDPAAIAIIDQIGRTAANLLKDGADRSDVLNSMELAAKMVGIPLHVITQRLRRGFDLFDEEKIEPSAMSAFTGRR
tara:strand:+ start:362 stop:10942 length:10581 start_codon:yes stop_codon:yes gene_type:complete